MRCREAQGLLVAFQDDELDEARASAVAAHLDACPTCRAREARLAAVTPRRPPLHRPPMDPDWSRLDAAIDHFTAVPAPPAPAPAPWTRAAALAAYAAVLGLALAWGVQSWLRAEALEQSLAAAQAAATAPAGTSAMSGDASPLPGDALRPASWSPDAQPPAP